MKNIYHHNLYQYAEIFCQSLKTNISQMCLENDLPTTSFLILFHWE